jgi:hypothetical protein
VVYSSGGSLIAAEQVLTAFPKYTDFTPIQLHPALPARARAAHHK